MHWFGSLFQVFIDTIYSSKKEEKYDTVRKLGSGSFGEVFLMVSSEDPNIKVAEKRIVLGNRSIHFVNKEFSIHKQLSEIGHDNVIKMFEMRQCPSFYYFVLEYAENGDVFDRIIPGSGMKFSVAQKYFKQLIAGLKFINANHLIHRDIKPENLLITKNGK